MNDDDLVNLKLDSRLDGEVRPLPETGWLRTLRCREPAYPVCYTGWRGLRPLDPRTETRPRRFRPVVDAADAGLLAARA